MVLILGLFYKRIKRSNDATSTKYRVIWCKSKILV